MSIDHLCEACEAGDNIKVQSILAERTVDVNSPDTSCGWTPLQHAMWHNHPNIVTILLSKANTMLYVTDRDGMTALHMACWNNSVAVISIFGRDHRCTPAIVNIKDSDEETAVMVAVRRGYLDCVRELSQLQGINFSTKNMEGESLMRVALKHNHLQIVQFLEEEKTLQGTINIAGNTSILGSGSRLANTQDGLELREIADELDNIQAIESVMVTEEEVMEDRHNEEIASLGEKQKLEMEKLKQKHDNIRSANKTERKNLEKKLQGLLKTLTHSTPSAPPAPSPDVPECPACMEEMKPPTQLFTCRNGHLICSVCRPRLSICTTCREEYTGRATAVEQMLRQMFNVQ